MKLTIDTKLRSFQYKYLMYILLINEKLFKYGMIESSLCDFCSTPIETNTHLFWECIHKQQFWCQINNCLNEKPNTSSDNLITYLIIYFCNVDSNNQIKSNCITYIILLGEYFIFKNKYEKTIPNFNDFKYNLKYNLNLKGFIAERKDTIEAHQNKWNALTTTLC